MRGDRPGAGRAALGLAGAGRAGAAADPGRAQLLSADRRPAAGAEHSVDPARLGRRERGAAPGL